MKPSTLLIVLSLFTFALFSSCKKTDDVTPATDEIATTLQLSEDQGRSDNFEEDDNDLLMVAAEEQTLLGNFAPDPVFSNSLLVCATITVTPQTGFPKTILIDFGPVNCPSPNNVNHRGKIRIVISDTLRRPNSTAVMTFEDYYVNDYKREGIHTWTNTSTPGTKSWQRKIENGKVTAPNGRFWLHRSIKDIVQTAGVHTPRDFRDDIISITGHAATTNPAGITRTSNILLALQKKFMCRHIDQGRIRFEGPNHYAILDYGNGICDNIATISIDGNPPRTILLH